MKHTILLLTATLLAGCTATTGQSPLARIAPPPPRATGLDRVMGHDARALQVQVQFRDRDALAVHRGANVEGAVLQRHRAPPHRQQQEGQQQRNHHQRRQHAMHRLARQP